MRSGMQQASQRALVRTKAQSWLAALSPTTSTVILLLLGVNHIQLRARHGEQSANTFGATAKSSAHIISLTHHTTPGGRYYH